MERQTAEVQDAVQRIRDESDDDEAREIERELLEQTDNRPTPEDPDPWEDSDGDG